jgi:hypothetical protein
MSDKIDPRAVEPPAPAKTPDLFDLDEMIERWWLDYFPGSAVARDTEAWNVAHAAKEALKRLLEGSA